MKIRTILSPIMIILAFFVYFSLFYILVENYDNIIVTVSMLLGAMMYPLILSSSYYVANVIKNRQKIQEIREPDPFWAFVSYLFDKKAN